LGIPAVDLTGDRDNRSPEAVGLYRFGEAVGITSYANLFNVNPVIRPSGVLILDDVHGGEQRVVDMWTVRVNASSDTTLYESLLAVLKPVLTSAQLQALSNPNSSSMQMADSQLAHSRLEFVTALLDNSESASVRYAWQKIRNSLSACFIFLSHEEISIRPLVPPTETHDSFHHSDQRIYMSATLGTESDLQRALGLRNVTIVRAQHPQWGRRYIIVPEVAASEETGWEILGKVWERLTPRRSVLLSPSGNSLKEGLEKFQSVSGEPPLVFDVGDITESLEGFTSESNAVLGIAGRYDGIDLPDDKCRLLVMYESPRALGELERYMQEQWKLGPLLQKRERVRLVQGLGRCTRTASDFAIVFWMGQSLVDAVSDSKMMAGLPHEIRSEVSWGVAHSLVATVNGDQLVEMAIGLVEDAAYRNEANQSIVQRGATLSPQPELVDSTGSLEVRFAAQLWEDDISGAYLTAREIADALTAPEFAGYRGWWWYLASCMAARLGDSANEQDCLKKAAATGVNRGWLSQISRARSAAIAEDEAFPLNTEGLWDYVLRLGTAGPRFGEKVTSMRGMLAQVQHQQFHEGLEVLGNLLGASVTRTSAAGAPDVVWSFDDRHIAFEAKTEMTAERLSKRDVQQAAGHANWVRSELSATADVVCVLVGPTALMNDDAKPHAADVFYSHPDEVREFAEKVAGFSTGVRAMYSGREYAEFQAELASEINTIGLSVENIFGFFTSARLLAEDTST
jgi:hypothetical protein